MSSETILSLKECPQRYHLQVLARPAQPEHSPALQASQRQSMETHAKKKFRGESIIFGLSRWAISRCGQGLWLRNGSNERHIHPHKPISRLKPSQGPYRYPYLGSICCSRLLSPRQCTGPSPLRLRSRQKTFVARSRRGYRMNARN
jgi:hypothetical protein